METITATVNNQDKDECDAEIKIEEIEEAINQLKVNKSPGIDGITNEFYKAFKDKLLKILKQVYDEIFKKGEINQAMKMGLVKIIFKRKGEREDLKNYRPITMLNVDFKIFCKNFSKQTEKSVT